MCEYPDTCSGIGFYDSNELILINGSGDRRTIFVKELYSTDNYGISKVEMDGTDSDNDGAVDDWVCASAYEDCTGPEMYLMLMTLQLLPAIQMISNSSHLHS